MYQSLLSKYTLILLASFIFKIIYAQDEPHQPVLGLMKQVKPGWVRFCSGEQYYDVFGNQCPAGFFWKSDAKLEGGGAWDCICTRGPWRRNNKWCSNEETLRFTQGDTSCFQPEKDGKVEGMSYLGDPHSAWDSGDPILLTSYTSGFTIRHDDFAQKWSLPARKFKDAGILIARPRDDWTVEDQNNPSLRLCLRAPPPTFDESIDGIYIYDVSMFFNGSNSDFKLAFTRTCYSWDKTDGKTWFEVVGESLDDKNVVVPKYDNSTAPDSCKRCMSYPIPEPPTTDVYGKPLKAAEKRAIYDLKHVGVLTSEVNLQTERLGLYWANRLLRDETDYVKENLQEVEILTKAAIMAYGTCDLNYIPKQFYQYFLLMFRRLLSESFKKYAPISPINPEYYKKIGELMDKCQERTKPIEFVVDGKSCPQKYKQYKGSNGTQPIPQTTDYNATPAKQDYLLEFIWRLKSFLHYNCFPEFKEDSVLHDLIQNQLENLFTEDILLRWFNPSKAFKMYEHIFKMHVDLRATMSNFENCVRVVHEISGFPVWLKRPIDQPHRAQNSLLSRRKRQLENQDIEEPLLEAEFEDMGLENIREKRGDDDTEGGEDETDKEGETENTETDDNIKEEPQSGEGETEEEEGDDEGSKDNKIMTKSKNVDTKSDKNSVEVESGESMYSDSTESEGGKHPAPLDKVWNKFSVPGIKGFMGACIQSMSSFKEYAKKDVTNCW